jgi:hypothetical protein
MADVNPREIECPAGHFAPPCPLHGGTMPELVWAPPDSSHAGDDELALAPGPEMPEHRFGTCPVCESQLMTDRDGAIIAAEPTTP